MSFSVNNLINEINANIIYISEAAAITIPTSISNGFRNNDLLVSLQNDANFLSNTLETGGFVPLAQSGKDPISNLSNQLNYMVYFLSLPGPPIPP
jgi:hypothetical protein